jgi:general secretion pathway protein J
MTRQDGYTLLELLVAMLLLSIIGVICAGGLQFGTAAWSRTERVIADTKEIDAAQDILRALLGHAVPVRQDGLTAFDGEARRVAFTSPAPQALGAGGLAQLEISAEADRDGGRLVLRASARGGSAREAVLARGLGAMHISYLDASERVPVWLALWRDRDRLPDAVRFEADAAGGPWTLLIVHPRIAQSAACDYDPESASCRS